MSLDELLSLAEEIQVDEICRKGYKVWSEKVVVAYHYGTMLGFCLSY